jgi:Ribonuclease H2 non-catalytic subunit (Ylr154p-like)
VQSRPIHENEDDGDASEEEAHAEVVKLLKEEARFDMITVWGHDRLPAADDKFVKGIDEWIAFAEAVWNPHCRLAHADAVIADSRHRTRYSTIFGFCFDLILQERTRFIHGQHRQSLAQHLTLQVSGFDLLGQSSSGQTMRS